MEICIDRTGKMNGRGAYVCRDVNCIQKVIRSGALARSLKCSIPSEIGRILAEEVQG